MSPAPRNHLQQHGIALVAALFLLVVLGGIGVTAVRMSGVQQQTVTLALLSARALHAARSGIEWGAHQALVNGSCTSNTLALGEAGLAGFSVQVQCTSTTHTEGPATTTVYALDAFARAGAYGQPDYVSRRIRASVSDTT